MITYISTPDYYRDCISHHGILGMHWGKRNGPPYPLDASDHSASEKKAGWKKSLGSGKIVKKKTKSVQTEEPSKIKSLEQEMKSYNFLTEDNLDDPKNEKRADEAAKIGLEALYSIRPDMKGDDFELDKDWFLLEDQTIGLPTIADMVNQGKSKKEILSLIEKVDSENRPATRCSFRAPRV